jgi:hypothetical protein
LQPVAFPETVGRSKPAESQCWIVLICVYNRRKSARDCTRPRAVWRRWIWSTLSFWRPRLSSVPLHTSRGMCAQGRRKNLQAYCSRVPYLRAMCVLFAGWGGMGRDGNCNLIAAGAISKTGICCKNATGFGEGIWIKTGTVFTGGRPLREVRSGCPGR